MAKYISEDMLVNHIVWLIQHEDDKIHYDTARRIIEDIEQMCCVCNPPVIIEKGEENDTVYTGIR